MYKSIVLVSAVALLLCSGCVTGRRSVPLSPQSPFGPEQPPATKTVQLAGVLDQRLFANKPADPSTPSIKGDVNTLSAEAKSQAIGRQRNAYGKAMGDVFLPENQTVNSVVQQMVARCFAEHGVQLVDTPDAGASAEATVEIDQFWGWMTPGMWSVPFEAEIRVQLKLTAGGHTTTLVVEGTGRNQAQVASDANWQLAYQRAFADFQTKLAAQLKPWIEQNLGP